MINRIKKLFKNNEARQNVSTVPMGEQRAKGSYVGYIIRKKLFDYYNVKHRKAVCQLDSVAKRLTYKFGDTATAKTFKFYSSHEVDGHEIMQEQRKRWIELGCDQILKECIVPFERDGYALFVPKRKGEVLEFDVYGEYESPPSQWVRDADNKILLYKVEFVPHPRGFDEKMSVASIISTAISGNENMRAIRKELQPKEVIHLTRGIVNYGCGDPLIEGAWDSIIKLTGDSHYDMLNKRKVPELHLTEDDYSPTEEKARGILKMIANSDEDTARVWYHKKDARGEITEYPKFAYSSASGNVIGGTTSEKSEGISTGDYGNIAKEWIRLCTITGHTIHYFAGNRAGAVTGSEADTDQDIEQEIEEFGLLEPVIKKILEWLESEGLISLPNDRFVIKYWKDWENIESKAKKEEQMLEQNPQKAGAQFPLDKSKEEYQKSNMQRTNELVIIELLNCIKNNMSYAMTSVMSSWIAKIGYYDKNDRLYMQLLSGQVYSKPAPMGEWSYLDWAEAGSKGGYFWDYLSQRDPPWQLDALPPELISFGDFAGTPAEMAIYKTELIGESREPFSVEDIKKKNAERKNPFAGYADWDDCISKNQDKDDPEAYCGKIKHETEDKKNTINYQFERIPMLDYQLIDKLDTETKIKRLGQSQGWSMGTSTATSIKRMLTSLKEGANKHQLRVNTLSAEAFGNSIKEHHPLKYDIGNGVIVEEFICPDSWKKNVGKIVPLGVYHNLDNTGAPELPEWQIVGTAEVFGWDDETGEDYVKYNYDYDMIDAIFEKLNQYNWLTPALKNNLTSDISTAYYCDIEYRWSEKLNKMVRVQTNIDLISISFVPRGNCPGEVCSLVEVKRNIMAMQQFIKNCIDSGEKKEACLATAYARFKNTP